MNEMHSSDERDLYRVAFGLSPAGMIAVDASGRILLANREIGRMFGYEPDDLIGRPIDLLVPMRTRSGHAGFRLDFFTNPEARPMGAGRDLSGLRRDGTEVPVEIGLNPVQTEVGLVVIASVVDISARREADRVARENEERARQARKLESLGTLAGGIAHDFNNILLGIVGYTELAQRQTASDPAVQADLENVQRAAERGRQLVQRILAFTRQREAASVAVQVDRVAREVLELLRASLPSTIEIRGSLDPQTPVVLSDETALHQIFMNLATNSAQAMDQGGTLHVVVEPVEIEAAGAQQLAGLTPGRWAHMRIADDGPGMPAHVRERAFEPFFTTKPAGKGTGLGLSVVLNTVIGMNGVIDLKSEPGRGTQVDIFLPARDVTAAEAPVPTAIVGTREKLHVLFVDDEVVLASMERRQLESLGYRVTVHTSSEQALDDFRSRPDEFDLLVTDNTMPRLTGLALASQVSRIRPGLPVLMISGYAENADPDVLREHGVTSVLRKPHTARELGSALRSILKPPA